MAVYEMWEGSYIVGDMSLLFTSEEIEQIDNLTRKSTGGKHEGCWAFSNGERFIVYNLPNGAYTGSNNVDYVITSGVIGIRSTPPLTEPSFESRDIFEVEKTENSIIIGSMITIPI